MIAAQCESTILICMVRFTVLGSGSKGNATLIEAGQTRLLVDCGLSCRELFKRIRAAGSEPEKIDALIVTHEHADHVAGISVTARKLGIPVYFTEGTHRAWQKWIEPTKQMSRTEWLAECRKRADERMAAASLPEGADGEGVKGAVEESANEEAVAASKTKERRPASWLPKVEHFQPGTVFSIGDLEVEAFTTPHDAADPVGFVFRCEGVRIGYATDLGYMPPNVKAQLKNLNLLLLESNHDLEMLRDGPYPWSVKQRVLSRVGHLSNDATAEFLAEEYDGSAKYVILAHLSENNNLPELARIAAERALAEHPQLMANRLLLAAQGEPLESLYF